jgi:hypothetical protein
MKRLILAAASLAAIACSDATTGGGAGRTRVYLTDSPFPYGSISAVNVYIARIEASATTDTTGLNPQSWVTIATPERTFNLLDFQGGAATLLGEADLPADQYAAVRVVINTGRSSVINSDGSQATVHWPISGDLSLYAIVEQPLAVTSAGAQIVLDFDVGRTFLPDGGGGFYLIPWIRAVNQAATGSIAGTVTASSIEGESLPFVNAAVSVYHSGLDDTLPDVYLIPLGTSHSDAQGHYTVAFLPPGSYRVVATDPGFPQRSARKAGVQVTVGGQTRVDLPMVIDTSTGGGTDTTGVDTTGAPSGPVASLTISPATQTVSVGDSAVAMAFTLNAQGQTLTGRTVTWSVSDSSVVRVTQAAYNWILLRGAKSGSVTLTAASESVSATATVTVR